MIEATIARITDLGYLDDSAYAARRALLLAERGYGDFAIQVGLEGLDLPDAIVAKAISSLPYELSEKQRMNKLIDKREDLPKNKLIRFLSGRGFPLDLIIDEIGGVDL